MKFTALVFFALFAGLSSCKTTVPASDSTPPTIEFVYRIDGTDEIVNIPSGGAEIIVDPAVKVFLTATGTDSGGVQEVWIEGDKIFGCGTSGAGGLGGTGRITISASASHTAGVGDSTESSRMVGAAVRLERACSSGSPEGAIPMRARALNYHGGETLSGVLKIRAE